jgi:murein DD-endopeptidase MepM/ murein hydrolase activator NlpD
MRFLVPAASAALIVVSLSATATAVPDPGTRSAKLGSASVSTTSARSAQAGPRRSPAAGEAANATRVASRGDFAWPLSPRPAVRRRFERPLNQWSQGHRGVDLSTTVGQPVLSAGRGVVAFSGVIAGRGVVTVRHSGGLRTTYDPVDERLRSGAVVHRGDRIGVVSPAPGHCAPVTCLHWGAISGQTYRDPLSLLGFGRPVLLPLG